MPLKVYAIELLTNGNFENGLTRWNINDGVIYNDPNQPLLEDPSNSGNHKFNLAPDFNPYTGVGPVFYQPLNVTSVANKTINLSMKLTNVDSVTDGQTVGAYIAYVTNTNDPPVLQKIGTFNNADIGYDTLVTASYTLPQDVRKIIGFGIAQEYFGRFFLDDILLTIDSATIGNVPIITNIDKTSGPSPMAQH